MTDDVQELDPPLRQAAASQEAFSRSVRLSVADLVGFLLEALGRALVLDLSATKDATAVSAWAAGDRQPRTNTEQRLRTAYRAFLTVDNADNAYGARAWFIGLNPQLDDEAPVTAIREGRLRDVLVAAESFAQTS